jgi:hypothetical protein
MEVALPGDVLSALASDCVLTVSLSIGSVLIDGLSDDGYTGMELVAVLLLMNTVTAAVSNLAKQRSKYSGIGQFVGTFFELLYKLSRMTLASCISQLVVANEPLRAARIVSLLSILALMVFLSATPNAHLKQQ